MSKNKWLFLFAIVLVCTFAVLIVFYDFGKIWFSLAICFVGMYSLLYSKFYHLDSHTFYGVLLISLSFVLVFASYMDLSTLMTLGYTFSAFAISHLAVYVFFRQNIHFKIFAFFACYSILLLTYEIKLLPLFAFILGLILVTLVLAFNVIFRARKNLRRR